VGIFQLRIQRISRGAGRSAPAAAAYRAGERIRDERTGKLHNQSGRADVTHTEIFLPSHVKQGEAGWARDRSRLWNAAEAAERRRNSLVAREYQISLPHELTASQRLDLARKFSRELADRHRIAVDLAVHDPRPEGDPRNFHAHLLVTTRQAGPDGLGAKAGLDTHYDGRLRWAQEGVAEIKAIRERLASLTNDAYKTAGLDLRVDPRTLAAQGIDREPMRQIPFGLYQMQRRQVRRETLERLSAQYRERIGAQVRNAEHQDLVSSSDSAERTLSPAVAGTPGAEEVRRRARESWLALRREALDAANTSGAEPQSASPSPAAARDEDLGL
jgi:ATP-dependent exoDNAse (exonuclease V) alpha subunit